MLIAGFGSALAVKVGPTNSIQVMSDIQLPVVKAPDQKALEVQVVVPERAVTEEEALDAMRRQGKVEIPTAYLKDMETVGIYVRKAAVNIQRGKTMLAQSQVEAGIKRLAELIATAPIKANSKDKTKGALYPEKVADLTRALSALLGKYTDSQRFTAELEEILRPPTKLTDPDQVQMSFPAGATVRPSTQIMAKEVHLHQAVDGKQKA